jgi:hypothetical protein
VESFGPLPQRNIAVRVKAIPPPTTTIPRAIAAAVVATATATAAEINGYRQ